MKERRSQGFVTSPDYGLGQSLRLHSDLTEGILLQHFLEVEMTVETTVRQHFVHRIGSHFENLGAGMTRKKGHLVVAGSAVVLGFVVAQVECHAEGDGSRPAPVGVPLALPMWTERNWRLGVKGYSTAMGIHYQYYISSNYA